MSEKERVTFIKKLAELDDVAAEVGGFVALNFDIEKEPRYNYRAISEYCKKKGIAPLDMTLRELNSFIVQ
ncbi:MAG: hypothetical protein IKD04_00755 [Clostridia bacterium]|nr:hypothetical protein [Clostridia bacterium]